MSTEVSMALCVAYQKDGPLGLRWVSADRDRRFATESAAHTHIMRIGVMFPRYTLHVVSAEWIGKLVEAAGK